MGRLLLLGVAAGVAIGLLVGWRAGRHFHEAHHRYQLWRGAVRSVPTAYRSAVDAAQAAVKYVVLAGLLTLLIAAIFWKAQP